MWQCLWSSGSSTVVKRVSSESARFQSKRMQESSSVGLISEASRTFLSNTVSQWQQKHKDSFATEIEDVKETVQTAICHIKRDLQSLSNTQTAAQTSVIHRLTAIEAQSEQTRSKLRTSSHAQKSSVEKLCERTMYGADAGCMQQLSRS